MSLRTDGDGSPAKVIQAALDARPFLPAAGLHNPHLQTMWSPLFRRTPSPAYRREELRTPDGEFLYLHHHVGEEDKPTVLLLHGLEGSHRSNYIRGLTAGFSAMGWGSTVLEFRSCSGMPTSQPRLYHLGETGDAGFVIEQLLLRKEVTRLYAVGTSLGGNVLAKWLGEQGDLAGLAGGVCICPPFDLTVSGPQIDTVLGGWYTRRFLRSLIPKALAKERQFPGCVDRQRVESSRTFVEFDSYATAAVHGFDDAWDYWQRSSCGQFLPAVRRPLLLLAAQDDPFNPASTLPRETVAASPYLYSQFPKRGGHVGFISGSLLRPQHWAEEQAVRFLRLLDAEEDRL